MCRFLAYLGRQEVLLSKLLEEPENSLIKQSLESKEGTHKVNADGFGIAWYNEEVSPNPGIFRSVRPAWNDKNLISLCNIIQTNCLLAHIRAATIGDISLNNCHPFSYENISFVHNGSIKNFEKIRRKILNQLDDELFEAIGGRTDSEHFFFLVISFMRQAKSKDIEQALLKAIDWVVKEQDKLDDSDFSNLNVAITDGKKLIVTKYSSKQITPLSLYYTTSKSKEILEDEVSNEDIVIASEPLTNMAQNWVEIPPNHYIVFDLEKGLEVKSFK